MKYAIPLIVFVIIVIYALSFLNKIGFFSSDTKTNQQIKTVDSASLKNLIEKTLEKESLNGVIFVAIDDQPIFVKVNGFANHEEKIKIEEKTEFLIGSITKLFTATAILKLEELGKLDLNLPISVYLKNDSSIWGGNAPSFSDSVTIHQLLTHTSGIEDYTKLPGFTKFNLNKHDLDELIQFFSDYPLKFEPGSTYEYSTSNYALLGAIIEKVSEQKFADFLKTEFFTPLNMRSTSIPQNDFLYTIQESHPLLASGYGKNFTSIEEINLSSLFGEGSAISSAPDLYTWIKALFQEKIISASQLKKMITPYFETKIKGVFTGYGFFITEDASHNPIYLSIGSLEGYDAILSYEPKQKISVIILSNKVDGQSERIAKEIMDIISH